MKVTETRLRGCFIIEPQLFKDERGYFFESFNEARFNERMGISTHFVQDNQSFSTRGVIRGLHAQTGDFAQAKLVRVLQGEVLDVAVDARPGSPTFGQHVAVTLSAANQLQFFIPRGFFARIFCTFQHGRILLQVRQLLQQGLRNRCGV